MEHHNQLSEDVVIDQQVEKQVAEQLTEIEILDDRKNNKSQQKALENGEENDVEEEESIEETKAVSITMGTAKNDNGEVTNLKESTHDEIQEEVHEKEVDKDLDINEVVNNKEVENNAIANEEVEDNDEDDDDFGDFSDASFDDFEAPAPVTIQAPPAPVDPNQPPINDYIKLTEETYSNTKTLTISIAGLLSKIYINNPTTLESSKTLKSTPTPGDIMSPRSQALWNELKTLPRLNPPDWKRSSIRRHFLTSIGVPIDLDEVLPGSSVGSPNINPRASATMDTVLVSDGNSSDGVNSWKIPKIEFASSLSKKSGSTPKVTPPKVGHTENEVKITGEQLKVMKKATSTKEKAKLDEQITEKAKLDADVSEKDSEVNETSESEVAEAATKKEEEEEEEESKQKKPVENTDIKNDSPTSDNGEEKEKLRTPNVEKLKEINNLEPLDTSDGDVTTVEEKIDPVEPRETATKEEEAGNTILINTISDLHIEKPEYDEIVSNTNKTLQEVEDSLQSVTYYQTLLHDNKIEELEKVLQHFKQLSVKMEKTLSVWNDKHEVLIQDHETFEAVVENMVGYTQKLRRAETFKNNEKELRKLKKRPLGIKKTGFFWNT